MYRNVYFYGFTHYGFSHLITHLGRKTRVHGRWMALVSHAACVNEVLYALFCVCTASPSVFTLLHPIGETQDSTQRSESHLS